LGGDELKHFVGTGQTENTAPCYCWTVLKESKLPATKTAQLVVHPSV